MNSCCSYSRRPCAVTRPFCTSVWGELLRLAVSADVMAAPWVCYAAQGLAGSPSSAHTCTSSPEVQLMRKRSGPSCRPPHAPVCSTKSAASTLRLNGLPCSSSRIQLAEQQVRWQLLCICIQAPRKSSAWGARLNGMVLCGASKALKRLSSKGCLDDAQVLPGAPQAVLCAPRSRPCPPAGTAPRPRRRSHPCWHRAPPCML